MLDERDLGSDKCFFELIVTLFLRSHRPARSSGTPDTYHGQSRKKQERTVLPKGSFLQVLWPLRYPVYSQYIAGNYSPMLEKVRKEWQSYTGKIFEDIVRELLVEKMISDYPELGSWWNRKGDEIDILGIDHQERKA